MPPISEAQQKALVGLCGKHASGRYTKGRYPIKGIYGVRTLFALRNRGFVKTWWDDHTGPGLYTDPGWYMQATAAGRAYVELLKEIEKLKEKKDEHQG